MIQLTLTDEEYRILSEAFEGDCMEYWYRYSKDYKKQLRLLAAKLKNIELPDESD